MSSPPTYLNLGIGGCILFVLRSIRRGVDVDAMVADVLTDLGERRKRRKTRGEGEEGGSGKRTGRGRRRGGRRREEEGGGRDEESMNDFYPRQITQVQTNQIRN